MLRQHSNLSFVLQYLVHFSDIILFLGDKNIVFIQLADHFSPLLASHFKIFGIYINFSRGDLIVNFFHVYLIDTSKTFLTTLSNLSPPILLLSLEVVDFILFILNGIMMERTN